MNTQTKWTLDQAHSDITFKVKHLMISHVNGSFKTFDANIYTTNKDFSTAQVDLFIDVNSITTGNEKRDEHLKSADFFDIENHKQISFISGNIEKADEKGNHELWGELTIKGITKNIKLNAQYGGTAIDPWGNEKIGFAITGIINRTDWGLNWNTLVETGGIMVGEEIKINCAIELTNATVNTNVEEENIELNEAII